MAPPRASLVQPPQSPQPVAVSADAAKGAKTARRRKTKQQQHQQQQQSTQQQQQQQQQQQEHLAKPQKTNGNPASRDGAPAPPADTAAGAPLREPPQQPLLAASERTPMKPQVAVAASNPVNEEKPRRAMPALAVPEPGRLVASKQQSTDEADEIDAGIELDGSSNSGSSVKDITDDQQQLKSNSVSPVMAQSNLVVELVATNETTTTNYETAQVAAPGGQLEKLAGSEALLCAALGPAKKVSTKQQLAANQQVIDADEQLLQAKLQSKQQQQRKCSLDTLAVSGSGDATAPSTEQVAGSNPETAIDAKQTPVPLGRTNLKSTSGAPLKRRFSSQGSQDSNPDSNPSATAAAAAASLCKICNQHVYQMERMMAEKFVYHKRCFRCHQCKQQLLVSSYSSHEGLVYCKLHHRQLFQPQVKLDNEDDVDIVAKSRIRKRQMIICENEPAELPKDIVRSDTKVDDGIDLLNLNLNNILEKFERGTAEGSQPSTASSTIIEKPSFNIKKTLMAFERQTSLRGDEDEEDGGVRNNGTSSSQVEKPVVGKLTSLNGFLNRQNSQDGGQEISLVPTQQRPFAVKRSESLMMRLKKYESRIAGEQVDDDEDDEDRENAADAEKGAASERDENNNSSKLDNKSSTRRNIIKTELLPSVDLSSLKSQWESRDICKVNREADELAASRNSDLDCCRLRSITAATTGVDELAASETNHTSSTEKDEELLRVRQELAQRKLGDSAASVRNIYENAIREAELQQKQQQASARRDLTDLAALNGISAQNIIQRQFLRQSSQPDDAADGDKTLLNTHTNNSTNGVSSPPVKGARFQLNLSNRANKLKERFELGLIRNSSQDDSDLSDQEEPEISRLEQIKREKLEDLSVFTEGEIKAREARSLFQQIDRRISQENSNGGSSPRDSLVLGSRSLASISASMQAKLTSQMNNNNNNNSGDNKREDNMKQQPIRLTNNVRT